MSQQNIIDLIQDAGIILCAMAVIYQSRTIKKLINTTLPPLFTITGDPHFTITGDDE